MKHHGVKIQKVCWFCHKRSARYQQARVPSLMRFTRETRGVKVDTYAHPACLERVYGRAWALLCDPTELKLWTASKREKVAA